MDIWTAKAESGFTLARDSRSVERTKKLPWNVWMDKPETTLSRFKNGFRGTSENTNRVSHFVEDTFSASYSHDGLESDLPGEVAIEVPLKLLQLRRVVDVMKGGVVKDAARRVLGDTC